jgi:hypothetical protein
MSVRLNGSDLGQKSNVLTWTNRLQTASITNFTQMATNGSNIYVAVSNGGALYSSPDAITWTSRTSGFGANAIYDVQYGNGLFVAVGNNGTITTSTDGTTWTARTSNMSTNAIYAVAYANSLWVAVGNGGGATNTGGITYSSDGITWTRKSQTPTVGTAYSCVGWNGTNWIVGASFTTNNYLYASTPSGTWTAGSDGSSNALIAYFWDGTRNIVASQGAVTVWRYSTSATLGTTTNWNSTSTYYNNSLGQVKLYNNNLHLVTAALQILTPSSTPNPVTNAPQLLPTTNYANDGSSNLNTFIANTSALLVTASGYIIGDIYGRIYTSF